MVKNRQEEIAGDRRQFLKMAGLGTVTGGAVIATAGTVKADTIEEEKGSGYRKSEHVQTYYDLAKF